MTRPTVERRQRTSEATTHDDKLQRLYGAMDGCLSVQAQRRIVEVVVSRDDAYMLASVAADLHITELVDGNKGVHMMIPKAIFVSGAPQ